MRCRTEGCERPPLTAEEVAALVAAGYRRASVAGRCAECAFAAEYPGEEQRGGSRAPASDEPTPDPATLAADRAEAEAFARGAELDPAEVLAGHLAAGPVAPDDLRELAVLLTVEERGAEELIDDDDRRIVEAAVELGAVRPVAIAATVGYSRQTVHRRLKRLREAASAAAAGEDLGHGQPITTAFRWRLFLARFQLAAGILPEGFSVEQARDFLRTYAGLAADRRRVLRKVAPSLRIERRGDRLLVTGRGPLPPDLAAAVADGRAEWHNPDATEPPPRCPACGRFVRQPATGRPRRFCDQACRGRWRRRQAAA